MNTIADRISAYLQSGGLFNPEMANHEAVRDLLIDAKNEIERLERLRPAREYIAEKYGVLAGEPMEIAEWVNYETRAVRCAACGARMPNAPWPTNSAEFAHRPRCGRCGSFTTYPVNQPTGSSEGSTTPTPAGAAPPAI